MNEKKAKKLAKEYFHWWTRWLGLRYGEISLEFVDSTLDVYTDGTSKQNYDAAAACHTDWKYQESTIQFSKPHLIKMSKNEIEKTIVHELMHILLNEMREAGIDHEERVATNLQKAFFWVREGVKEK